MFTLTTKHHFDAAHFLKGYVGKCSNLHGHRWEVVVEVQGNRLDSVGILCDFGLVRKYLKEICDKLDHKCLNDIFEFNATAENLSKYIFDELAVQWLTLLAKQNGWISAVTVFESPDSSCEWRPDVDIRQE